MSRQGMPEVHRASAGDFAEDIVVVFRADRTPIETWSDREWSPENESNYSTHIPSAFSEIVSTTIFLSASRHLFIIVSASEYTTDLT